jgi:hypothetical protein
MELVVHSSTCGHVGLLPEVELAIVKLLLIVDERCQCERLLLVVFVRGFQGRYMDSSLALVYENDSQIYEKNITKNKCHACKKEFMLKTLFKQKNCMQDSSLNTTPSS